ncbi:MAG: topoisomerase DNA-binding C4 zinc finger domain-containing protein, partial [Leptospiraceae bacterium]|nr:topoisomerase DNA-binding C4 zinc finger domain-containing protein [Leptospiraceae bacterium]
LDKVADSAMDWVNMLREFYKTFEPALKAASENIADMKNALDIPTDHVCEKCGRQMVRKIGRFGYFLACPGFPECRNAQPLPLGDCPTCKDGKVIKRSTKKGRPFYGCSNYPECEFATWDKPSEGEMCPECGKMLFEKTTREKGKHNICHGCGYESDAIQTA